MNAYTKIKADYDHLLGRTWDLFKFGLEKEGRLKGALTNAWKNFERIAESDDPQFIRNTAETMRDFTADVLKREASNSSEPETNALKDKVK